MRFDTLLLTCEHGGNQVPTIYQQLFSGRNAQRILQSHRGYDAGALQVANHLNRLLRAPLIASEVTRLLVDLNRSQTHPAILSEFSSALVGLDRQRLFEKHYTPHRTRVEKAILAHAARGSCTLHLAIHSFTPKLDGEVRNADIGLLYDPKRKSEKHLCARWKAELAKSRPELRVRHNYPYRGNADGLTTALRKRFDAKHYLGIEVELNQRLVASANANHRDIAKDLAESLVLTFAMTR